MRLASLGLALALSCASVPDAPPAHAAGPFVAGVSVTTPRESLYARAARFDHPPHLSAQASPGRAALISVLATAVPVAVGASVADQNDHATVATLLVISGVIVGPAAGYFDSGLSRRGALGIGLRTLTATIAFGGIVSALENDSDGWEGPAMVFLVGAGTTGVLAIADCALVAHDVARAQRTSFEVSPMVRPLHGAPAVGIAMRF